MKLPLKSLLAVLAFAGSAIFASAQAPKIVVVDIAKLYDGHYKTEEQNAKLRTDEQRAQAELERLNAEGNRLVEQFNELREQTNNPALSDSARTKVEQDAQAKVEEIQRKQEEVERFRMTVQQSMQQRIRTFRDLLLEEITKVVTDVARRQNATLVLDKSGPSLIGISSVVYADASFDITDAVQAEINRTRPAGTPASTGASSGASSSATPANNPEPAVTFPGARKN